MDKPNVDSTIDALASLVKDGHTPAHDFSLNELEGILAFKLGVDVLSRVNYICRLASISFAGSPPWPGPVAGQHWSGSWGRQTPG